MRKYKIDPNKEQINLRKHKAISLHEAIPVFESDKRALTLFDPDHSEDELRYTTIGFNAEKNRIIRITHTEEDDGTFNIISVRRADKFHRDLYNDQEL